MPTENFETIVSHGDWLETLLTKDTPWHLKRQFQTAIELLGLDYEMPENDLSLRLIDKIEAEKLHEFNIAGATTLSTDGTYPPPTLSFIGKDADNILAFLKDEWANIYAKKHPFKLLEAVFRSIICMYKIKAGALEWFDGLLKRDIPWGFRPEVPYVLNEFIKSYNGIRKKLIYTSKDGFHNITAFADDQPQAELGIPVDVVLARILVDFVDAGGQDYFGFCEHCKRFYVSRRKQKKLYCSDTCRVNHHKHKVKKKKK